MKKYMAFVMAIFAMLIAGSFSGISAPTDYSFSWTDPAGDVTIPDIDITQVSSHLEGSDVVIDLVVAGNINTSSDYTYFIKITSDPTATSDYDVPTCYITYTGGTSMLMTATGYSTVNATISPHTLTFRLPTSTFQEFPAYYLESASAQYSTSAIDMVVPDYGGGGSSGGSGGGGSSGSTVDPATETPTDTSISVKITEVKVNVNKVDNGQNWQMKMTIKGTTTGADHVSLTLVTYYSNGTKDVGGWMRGPMEVPTGTHYGVTVNKYSFNATSENWKTWELQMDMKTPVSMEDEFLPNNTNDISKVRVYARAFADANETQWNQDYYEFTPSTTEDSLNYDSTSSGSSGGGSSGGGTPGFEAAAAITALSIASLAYAYRRRR